MMRCRSNQHVMVMLMYDIICSLEIKTILSHTFITSTANDVTELDQIQK